MKKISGHIVDLVSYKIFDGIVQMDGQRILSVMLSENIEDQFIIPGFIDAHIHIESSMMIPSEFARLVLPHGTVACVCDPHEIANVCGIPGVNFMIDDGKRSPLQFYFGAPSCVPATDFDHAGATLDATDIKNLLQRDDIHFLAEMMNFPGVINDNEQVVSKLKAALEVGKPIDGHAPGLTGEALKKYVAAGITTDHECSTLSEAHEKMELGMKILIREGSAARNFMDLVPLLSGHADHIMFCSDDKHPDDILKNGHIDTLARRAVALGYPPLEVLRACSLNPIRHYKLDIGLLQPGDYADFAVVNNLADLKVTATYIRGEKVAESGLACFPRPTLQPGINNFFAKKITPESLQICSSGNRIKVISVEDGQLYTKCDYYPPKIKNGMVVSDPENDVLKLVVYNRYEPSTPAVGFIRNMGLKRGAMASTVSHDSHNIVAVGVSDESIATAINRLIDCKGGIVATDGHEVSLLPLPIGGLMSDSDGLSIAESYEKVDAMAKKMGSHLRAPFMTLAFMSLLCIPELKLGDKGLFDVLRMKYIDLMD
jgi:adenine deaminase